MSQQTEGTTRRVEDTQCAQAYKNSLQCLDKNNYDKSKCRHAFDDYKKCKKEQFEADKLARQLSKKGFFS